MISDYIFRAKDIVDILNANNSFKIFDTEENLIIEGKGSDIYKFLRYARVIVENEIEGKFVMFDQGKKLGDYEVQEHWEEEGTLYYRIVFPLYYKFSSVDIEHNHIYFKEKNVKNPLKDKISPLDKNAFYSRKTAAFTSLSIILCVGSFITGYILLYYTKVNKIIPGLLLLVCIITLPMMIYYIWKMEKWMNEK